MTKLNLSAVEQVSDEALIDEVNKRLAAGDIEAEAIEIKPELEAGGGIREEDAALEDIDTAALEEAAVRFARRDYPETLWNLEKALGREFAGLSDLVLGIR